MKTISFLYRNVELTGTILKADLSSLEVESLSPYSGLQVSKSYPFVARHVPNLSGPQGEAWAQTLLVRLYLVGKQIEVQRDKFLRLFEQYAQHCSYVTALQINLDEEDDRRDQQRQSRGQYTDLDHRQQRSYRVESQRCQDLLNTGIADSLFSGQFAPRLPLCLLPSLVTYLERLSSETTNARGVS